MNKKELRQIMSIQSKSHQTKDMQDYIIETLATLGHKLKKHKLTYSRDTYGNIYATKELINGATLYPTMVCHIDTVHDINKNVEVFERDGVMFAMDMLEVCQYGIGGDDKVGIYITLELLKHFDNFKAVFFLDEEVGCLGSSRANFKFFNDSTFILQCDRKGHSDFVNNIGGMQLYNKDIQDVITEILNNYDRKEVTGGMTDVQSIAENTDCQVANMSCGYYNPHTEEEWIDLKDIDETFEMCKDILTVTANKLYRMKRAPKIHYNYHNMWGIEDFPCPTCNTRTLLDDYDDERFCVNCMEYTHNMMEDETMKIANEFKMSDHEYSDYNNYDNLNLIK